jgi:hypothetical protein
VTCVSYKSLQIPAIDGSRRGAHDAEREKEVAAAQGNCRRPGQNPDERILTMAKPNHPISVDAASEPVPLIAQRLDRIGERIDRCLEVLNELIVELSA